MSNQVLQEATLIALSVMTQVDTNINPDEVVTVQRIMKEKLDVDVTTNEVYKAAKTEFIEDRSVDKYLKEVRDELSTEERLMLMNALKEIVAADGKAHDYEIDMFNKVAGVLELDPSELMDL